MKEKLEELIIYWKSEIELIDIKLKESFKWQDEHSILQAKKGVFRLCIEQVNHILKHNDTDV